MKNPISKRQLVGLQSKFLQQQKETQSTILATLECYLDPKDWKQDGSIMRHVIRIEAAIQLLVDLALASKDLSFREYGSLIGKFERLKSSQAHKLDPLELSIQDLWNLSKYHDAIFALEIINTGMVRDHGSIEIGSRIFSRQLSVWQDLNVPTVLEEYTAHEIIRRTLMGDTCYVRDECRDYTDDDLIQPQGSLFQMANRVCFLLSTLKDGASASSTSFGVDAWMAVLKIEWLKSRLSGAAELSSVRMLLLTYAVEEIQGRYHGDPQQLFEAMQPERIVGDLKAILTQHGLIRD